MINIKRAAAVTSLLLISTSAYAQVGDATRAADPSRLSQELMDFDTLPQVSNDFKVKGTASAKAPKGAENVKFILDTLMIDGVGAYTAKDLDPYYQNKLGTEVSLADIYDIANQLTVKYRNDGYILTQVVVPPQTIENGMVELRVVEGFVDKITIQGEEKSSAVVQIQKYADNLRENNILDSKKLERYLLLINDLPGVTARSVLSPSKTTTGASDLTIIVERDEYEAEVSFDNHGSRFIGPYRASYTGSINSKFGMNEKITGRFVSAGDIDRLGELLFGAISYEQPLSRFGSKLNISAGISETEPGDVLDQFDVEGHSKTFRIGVSHPFIRSRTLNFSGRANFDVRDTKSENNLEPTRKDKIRSVRLGTTLQFMDTVFGVGVNAIDFEVSKGTGLFGASHKGDANLTRAAGDPRYLKGALSLQRLQRISSNLNLQLTGRAQLASAALLSAEEFGVGGQGIGRGYDSSEIVGEDGIAGKAELQWTEPKAIKYLDSYQLFAFLDSGRVWNQDATTQADKRQSLTSTGLGVRASITEKTGAGFGIAFPLTSNVGVTDDRDPRYYFNITHKF